MINATLREAVLAQPPVFRDFSMDPAFRSKSPNKVAALIRNRLGSLLGTTLYDLDRLDLSVHSTIKGNCRSASAPTSSI